MGYMTELSILNDRWDEIRKEPAKFVEQIYMASVTHGREPNWIIGQTTVAKTHHADTLHVYYARGNSFFESYPDRDFSTKRLEYHLEALQSIKKYLKICEAETKLRLAKAEGK